MQKQLAQNIHTVNN